MKSRLSYFVTRPNTKDILPNLDAAISLLDAIGREASRDVKYAPNSRYCCRRASHAPRRAISNFEGGRRSLPSIVSLWTNHRALVADRARTRPVAHIQVSGQSVYH